MIPKRRAARSVAERRTTGDASTGAAGSRVARDQGCGSSRNRAAAAARPAAAQRYFAAHRPLVRPVSTWRRRPGRTPWWAGAGAAARDRWSRRDGERVAPQAEGTGANAGEAIGPRSPPDPATRAVAGPGHLAP